MQKTSLKYVGPRPYKSTDHVTGETVSVAAGDVVALSNEKASQVLRDFPASGADRPRAHRLARGPRRPAGAAFRPGRAHARPRPRART
jgi:hypothetical protein